MTSGSWGPVELAVWDVTTHERRTLNRFDGLPCHSNAQFSPDNQWLAASMSAGAPVLVWRTGTWPQVASLEVPGGCVRQVAFSGDGSRLAATMSGSEEHDRVVVWQVGSWHSVSQMRLADVTWQIALSTDGRWLLAGLGQGVEHPPANEGQLWDVDSGKLVARMPHSRQVLAVDIGAGGVLLATGSYDATMIWEAPVTR
jgi:WD40 repeat protein